MTSCIASSSWTVISDRMILNHLPRLMLDWKYRMCVGPHPSRAPSPPFSYSPSGTSMCIAWTSSVRVHRLLNGLMVPLGRVLGVRGRELTCLPPLCRKSFD